MPYSLEFIISPASPTTMRAISTCAVNEGRGTKQATIHKRRTANEELEQQSRGAQGVCCRPCQQIATKSSTNHQQQRRPRAPPRASSRVVASSRSSSREPLLVFVSLRVRLSISLHQVSRRSLLSLEVTIPRTSTSCSFSQSPKPPFVLVLIHCA